MERIDELFPALADKDKALVEAAYDIASKALEGETRSNGTPFIDHAEKVAKIAFEEIGLGPECIAAVFLHEATRGRQDSGLIPAGMFARDILTMVDGLNKIATIKPKDTRLEADNYKKLIVSSSTDPRVVVL